MSNNKEIFSNIYNKGLWPKPMFSKYLYYSGGGSHKKYIIKPYIKLLRQFIADNAVASIVDVGCGDFNIMSQVLADYPDVHYCGIDAAENLVKHNTEKFGNSRREFLWLDASHETDKFPKADLFICRQVLQHLSNKDIEAILAASRRYHYALITDSIYVGEGTQYNVDMETGASIRLPMKSGVYIDKPPFSLPHVAHILNVMVYEPKRSFKKLLQGNGLAIANIRTSLVVNW